MEPDPADLPDVSFTDPTQAPIDRQGHAWVWIGRGPIGGKEGSFVNPLNSDESLRPDLSHALPIGPHWDYTFSHRGSWRLFPDRTLRRK
jgi:hypothetical protein